VPTPASSRTPTTPQAQDLSSIASPLDSLRLSSVDVAQDSRSALPECYSLLHLELLHHYAQELRAVVTQWAYPDVDRILAVVYQEAFHTPYLMDEMLALSSAHKSTVSGEHAASYRTEATRLQTRALSRFTQSQVTDTDSNAVKCFAFSSLLCQHVLYDIFSSASDVPTILDRVIQCIALNHGIRAICHKSWNSVHLLIHDKDFVSNVAILQGVQPETPTRGECVDLLIRLEHSEASQSTVEICNDAVKILQYLFDSMHSSQAKRVIYIQEWPIRVSKRYISLLRERRPEALVVLAYYAVLLHYARDYWAVGDSGRALIHAISRHLGPFWEEWLAWPNQVLEQT